MTYAIDIIYLLVGCGVCGISVTFAVSSIGERKWRAAVISGAAAVVLGVVWSGPFFLYFPSGVGKVILMIGVAVLALAYYLPIGRRSSIQIDDAGERVDERDVIFAREDYHPGTIEHEQYYTMRPENLAIDDRIRALPELLEPGGRYYDPVRSKRLEAVFDVIEGLSYRVDGETESPPLKPDPARMTREIKKLATSLGADAVGIARLNSRYVYSHVGRGPEPWGSEITNNHKYAIVFALEMDYWKVETAPRLPMTVESALQYLRGSHISISLAHYIRSLGYPARAHVAGSNYQIMLPPLAHDAGLGELGRSGYLISPVFGPRMRLGAVSTDLPLITDSPIRFGVQDFCEKCLKCATNCPSGAIPKNAKSWVRGVEKWPLNVEKCIRYWRLIGTDCGMCMKVCPYSHPPTFVHGLVRAGIRRSAFARWISVIGDDVLYGRKADYPRA